MIQRTMSAELARPDAGFTGNISQHEPMPTHQVLGLQMFARAARVG